MNSKILKILELDKILKQLETYCSTYLGRAIIYNLTISSDIDEIKEKLNEVTLFQSLLLRIGNIPLTEIQDITLPLKKANINGILSFEELLNIAHTLKISREIKQYFFSDNHIQSDDYLPINKYFSNLYTNIKIEELILTNILDENTIQDSASSELASIRRNIKNLENKVRDTLNKYISSPAYSKYLQDSIITVKNGRYAIPIKQEYKNNIKGLVLDSSSSGSTLFIEPANIIQINNDIKELMLQEQQEIDKILYTYSLEISKISENIITSLYYIGYIDFLNAKATYSLKNDMYAPDINNEKNIKLIDARHPLIPENKVVPISLELSNKYNTLIITGPNTGGKTVTLKTIGLLTLMVQAGLHIPAKSCSNINIFNDIFADIGDEQSIEQNLSTFSSHIKTIINITQNITNNTLIILDELGSGTDPVEGAALAQGILEYLSALSCVTLCTTHYSELKTYAIEHENVLNASTEFDIKTLKPTYKLITGIPGKSNAFAISEKLGLNKDILAKANSYINNNNNNFENILNKIHAEKQEIEKNKKNTQSIYSKINETNTYLTKEKEKFDKEKQKLISEAKQEATQIVLNAKEEINNILDEIYNLKNKSNQDIMNTKNSINTNLKQKINELVAKDKTIYSKNNINKSTLKIGQTIYIKSLDKQGIILSINKDTVKVQIGIMKLDVDISDIDIIESNLVKKDNNIHFCITSKAQTTSTTLNVIGKTTQEALFELEKYIDDLVLAKIPIATIVHGKGTGILKKAIHTYLKTNTNIKSYRTGSYSEGQDGVTIIEL